MSLEQYHFKYEFRDYQKRILGELRQYLDDDKIHVVAPPGAGKTILALQLMLELNQPTLICVPTIALREQWIQQFREDFADNKDSLNNISHDLTNPKCITVCTYQSIYSMYKNKEEVESDEEQIDIVHLLKELKVTTIILDEAHHLKKSWWQALTSILNDLGKIKIISLTATPPYDVVSKEWNNYLELCGEIDAEISIPELVKQGNLCPHQDYIYFNYPSENDLKQFEDYNNKTRQLFEQLCQDSQFITAISLHPGVIHLNDKIDFFINEFEYFISILSFLQYKNIPITNVDILSYTKELPDFDIRQMEILLTYCLFRDKNSYQDFKKLFREIKRELNEIGAIEESKVNLIYSLEIKKLLSQNSGKLDSINKIIESEHLSLREQLKLVVVTDYIKEEINDVDEETDITMMGAIPTFKNIRKSLSDKNIIVLTGKIVIIPTSLKQDLLMICKDMNIHQDVVNVNELENDFDYSSISLKSNNQRSMVAIITELFKIADIQVLIGTSALIGEGWDAPFINSLIMASFTSTFVMSNQIRGRAIRTDKDNPHKTANIWHLICVEKTKDGNYMLGADYEMLERRFIAFEGVYLDKSEIDSGIERLMVKNEEMDISRLNQMNQTMIAHADNRHYMRDLWKEAVNHYTPIKKTHIPKAYTPHLKKHKQRVAMSSLLITSIPALFGLSFLTVFDFTYSPIMGSLLLLSAVALNGYKMITYRSNLQIIRKLGYALFNTFNELNMISHEASLVINKESDAINFYISDAALKESNMFSHSFNELLGCINAPRYILDIDGVNYQVPSMIGKNKTWANILRKNMKQQFSHVKLIYMKTENGKKELLRLKLKQVHNDEKRK